MNHIQRFRQRRIQRLENRFGPYHGSVRYDADDDSEGNNGGNNRSGGHGNTKIPYGLCQREGIKIGKDWTPKDAWDALAGKGYSAGDVYKELKTTGKVASRQPKEPEKPKLDKKQVDSAIKSYSGKKKEIKKLNSEFKKADKEFDEARLESNFEANKLNRVMDQATKIEDDYQKAEGWEEKDRLRSQRDEIYKKLREQTKIAEDAYNRKEELKKKTEELKSQISEAEKSKKELGDQCFKAIESSPIYNNVMDYRGIEEEAAQDRRALANCDSKIEEIKQKIRIVEQRLDKAKKDIEEGRSVESAKLVIGIYNEAIRSDNEKIKKLETDSRELRGRVAEFDKRMSNAKGDVKDKEWKQIYELSIERDTVQDGPYDKLRNYADRVRISTRYVGPRKYVNVPDEESIIRKIAGGDKTPGSCASVAFAYLANKAGYEVLDFRGGQSRRFFSYNCCEMVKGLGGMCERTREHVAVGMRMLSSVEEGKEYWFASARHAAVVRKKNGKLQYLELQDSSDNGWKDLDERSMANRFNRGKASSRDYGDTALIEASRLFESPEVMSLMGFINTEGDKQKRGAGGGVK